MSFSTHVLDTARGRPAAGVGLLLEVRVGEAWREIGRGATDADGRCRTLLGDGAMCGGEYRLRFEVGAYFEAQGLRSLYPWVEIAFRVDRPEEHYHIPLLVTANGYSTYRGS